MLQNTQGEGTGINTSKTKIFRLDRQPPTAPPPKIQRHRRLGGPLKPRNPRENFRNRSRGCCYSSISICTLKLAPPTDATAQNQRHSWIPRPLKPRKPPENFTNRVFGCSFGTTLFFWVTQLAFTKTTTDCHTIVHYRFWICILEYKIQLFIKFEGLFICKLMHFSLLEILVSSLEEAGGPSLAQF